MSDERAVQLIKMVAPRAVDVNEWLFIGSGDCDGTRRGHEAFLNPKLWGGVNIRAGWAENQAGAVFVAEKNHSISPAAGAILKYFFTRDGAAATVFEFDKFEGDFKSRRWEQISARIR